MAKKGSVTMDISKIHQLLEGLKTRAVIQVGVFEDSSSRPKSGDMTNAELAAFHEYGAPAHGLPARSMLRTPLADHAQELMAPFRGQAAAYLVKGTLLNLYKLIGVAAERVVLGAFTSGGYGKWPSLKSSTLMAKLKGSLKKRKGKLAKIRSGLLGEGILIDTGQLRRAFSSRVRMVH